MTAPHYYGSTSGILVDRFVKYGLFPFAYALGAYYSKSHDKAMQLAQFACFGMSAALTTSFLGMEADAIDAAGRDAVSAALGKKPEEITFSDYKYCDNIILKKAHEDLMHLQKYRYGTDMLFVLPFIVDNSYYKIAGKELPPSKDIASAFEKRGDKYSPDKYSFSEMMLQGHNGVAMAPYAGKALYWTYETFNIPKTSYYETLKLRENIESTGKDLRVNDLIGIYQRARNDRELPLIPSDSKLENAALRKLLQRMVDAYNAHDGTFGIAEIVYLIGSNRINVHDIDGISFSERAVEASNAEIDKVLSVGLSGIREENKTQNIKKNKLRVEGGSYIGGGITNANVDLEPQKTFIDRFTDSSVNAIKAVLRQGRLIPRKPEEYISPRDPTEIVSGGGVSR